MHTGQLTDTMIEHAIIAGDFSNLSEEQKTEHYHAVCKATGIPFEIRPFGYFQNEGKTQLMALKAGTDYARKMHCISVTKLTREVVDELVIVTVEGSTKDGRTDSAIGAIALPSSPKERADAIMSAETKAKKRLTISLAALGMLDESETEGLRARAAAALSAQSSTLVPEELPNVPEVNDLPAAVTKHTRPADKPLPGLFGAVDAPTAQQPANMGSGTTLQARTPTVTASVPFTPKADPLPEPAEELPPSTIEPPTGADPEPVSPAEPVSAVAETVPSGETIVSADEAMPDNKLLTDFLKRATKLVKGRLEKGGDKQAGNNLKAFLTRRAGKSLTKELTAKMWEEGLAAVEACTTDSEAVKLVRGA